MNQTKIFKLYPTKSQEQQLHEIFTIYNRIKRKGYRLFFKERDVLFSKNTEAIKELDNTIHNKLMTLCQNNPYVNSIRNECKKKLKQQYKWFQKKKIYLQKQITTILKKISIIKKRNKKDRQLRGLYS